MAQRVLITAGASGIGKEIARAYAAISAQVCVCDINEKALDAAAKDIPGLKTIVCDVSKRDDIERMVTASVKALGGLDVLVNNAGIANSGRKGSPLMDHAAPFRRGTPHQEGVDERRVPRVGQGLRDPANDRLGVPHAEPRALAANEPLRCQMDFTSPPSMRSVEPVIQRAPGDTRKAISSAISSGSP